MKPISKIAVSLSLLLASAMPAVAAEWKFVEAETYCAAAGANKDGSLFGLRFNKDNPPGVFLISAYNPAWNITATSAPLTIETQGNGGTSSFDAVAKVIDPTSVDFGAIEGSEEFLKGIALANTLVIKGADGRELSRFGLSGSKDAVTAALRCQAGK